MRRFSEKIWTILLAIVLFCGIDTFGYACDRSDVTFLSYVSGPGANYTLNLRLCVGGGVTGATQGANGDTRSIAFGFYLTPNIPPFSVISFSPSNMIGSYAGCNMPGIDIGAQGSPYNTSGTIFFADPGYYMVPPCVTSPYQCVSTTANCGTVTTQCTNFTFVINTRPDSMRIFGVEAGGNPVGGCYGQPDMLIDFTTFPVVWGDFSAASSPLGVDLKWSTLQEVANDYFAVERMASGGNFVPIGEVNSAGHSFEMTEYAFLDKSPAMGMNRYRLVQHDLDNATTTSKIVEVFFESPLRLSWGAVGPIPANDRLNCIFFNPDGETDLILKLVNLSGAEVMRNHIASVSGTNKLTLDLSSVGAGMYFLTLQGRQGSIMRKIILR